MKGQSMLTVILTVAAITMPLAFGLLWWADDKLTANAKEIAELKISDARQEEKYQSIISSLEEIKLALKVKNSTMFLATSTRTL